MKTETQRSIKEYIDEVTIPIFARTLNIPQEELADSMTTRGGYKSFAFRYLWRPNNYRRQIEVKPKSDSGRIGNQGTMGSTSCRTKLLTIKNYAPDITLQYGKKILTAIYSQAKIRGKKKLYLLYGNSIKDIEKQIEERRLEIQGKLDKALHKFSKQFHILIPYKRAKWSRYEDYLKGDEFIDKLPRDTVLYDTHFKKVYGEGLEFTGYKEEEPTVKLKNFIRNRTLEDIAPSIADAIKDVYRSFGSFISGMTNLLPQVTNLNVEVTKMRKELNDIKGRERIDYTTLGKKELPKGQTILDKSKRKFYED